MRTHLVIPDTQAKEGVPTDHLEWIGQYIVDRKPDVVIHLGDHADMPSLSSYDRGKAGFEGRRYWKDIKAANEAFDILNKGIDENNARLRQNKMKQWLPERHILLGNHEDRIDRAVENQAELQGALSTDDLNYKEHGYEVHPFKTVADIDGVWYSHYFYNPNTGNPWGGMIETRLRNIGHSFTQGHLQTLMHGIRYVGNQQQHGLVCGACLTPDHKVLTADLRYVPLGEVRAGDALVSFDETVEESRGRSRRYKTGTVEAVKRDTDDVFLVTLESGKKFKATADHLWMTRAFGPQGAGGQSTYQWRRTDSLRKGTIIPKLLDEWETLKSYDHGWLAGMFDGEGCYYTRTTKTGHVVAQLSVSQKPGLVMNKVVTVLKQMGLLNNMTRSNHRSADSLRLRGGLKKVARFLGAVRPIRLLEKFQPEHLGRLTSVPDEYDKVVSIEPLGKREIVRIAIDAKTMIVEGYGHHNCYLHDENYKGPQGNFHWRGIIVKHEVRNGAYDPMFVSLNFLCHKYEGVSLEKFMRKRYRVAA